MEKAAEDTVQQPRWQGPVEAICDLGYANMSQHTQKLLCSGPKVPSVLALLFGQCLRFCPHGDRLIYAALLRLMQPFCLSSS